MASSFAAKKAHILNQLDLPDDSYSDRSPKGSVDEGIRTLVDEINQIDGLVTTSSCAGRLSVYVEGATKLTSRTTSVAVDEASQQPASAGGKGGGAWLYVSHVPIPIPPSHSKNHFHSLFSLERHRTTGYSNLAEQRLIHVKFEPMIIHALSASIESAQRLLSAASAAGFRESGVMNLQASSNGSITPAVGVRSAGLAFDSIVGFQAHDGTHYSVVDESYLRMLVEIGNQRFCVNAERIERLRTNLCSNTRRGPESSRPTLSPNWEDATARKARKRTEGLKRQQAIRRELPERRKSNGADVNGDLDLPGDFDGLY